MTSPLRRLASVMLAAIAVLAAASCGGGGAVPASSPTPLLSGSLGVVEPAQATTAVEGLCRISAEDVPHRSTADAEFFDHVHEELHVIAAAVQPRGTDVAAALLQAKEQEEADLGGSRLPAGFADDVRALLDATRGALRTLGLSAPTCS